MLKTAEPTIPHEGPEARSPDAPHGPADHSDREPLQAEANLGSLPHADGHSQMSEESGEGRSQDVWLVVKTYVPGKSHTESSPSIPCQDYAAYVNLGQGWGIAAVCDGAGSKEYSHLGAQLVAERVTNHFERSVKKHGWQLSNTLPTRSYWHQTAKKVFAKARIELEEDAQRRAIDASLLSCTVIAVIHAPMGVLASHIGDGRAAFCNMENEWKHLIRPHKGEEANQTVFITSIDWKEPDKYIESTLFEEKPYAFALMSDGCEAHAFEVNIFNVEKQKYEDPNRPYPGFFQPLVATLKRFHQSQTPKEEIDAKWQRFIESGNEKLKNEPDDKSMILGALVG